MACAWGGFAGYGISMLMSYFVGQRLYPVTYPLRTLAGYTIIAAVFYYLITLIPSSWPTWLSVGTSTPLILMFAALIYWRELRKDL